LKSTEFFNKYYIVFAEHIVNFEWPSMLKNAVVVEYSTILRLEGHVQVYSNMIYNCVKEIAVQHQQPDEPLLLVEVIFLHCKKFTCSVRQKNNRPNCYDMHTACSE